MVTRFPAPYMQHNFALNVEQTFNIWSHLPVSLNGAPNVDPIVHTSSLRVRHVGTVKAVVTWRILPSHVVTVGNDLSRVIMALVREHHQSQRIAITGVSQSPELSSTPILPQETPPYHEYCSMRCRRPANRLLSWLTRPWQTTWMYWSAT
jgi:hypothetical protein